MNSQIRYLAIVSEQPETLANFYSTYFKMRELGRSDDGDVAVTDGFYNISILKQRSESEETGISHFGITIDDIGAVEARIKEFASEHGNSQRRRRTFPWRLSRHRSERPIRHSLHPSVPHTDRRTHIPVYSPSRRVCGEQRRRAGFLCQRLRLSRVDDQQTDSIGKPSCALGRRRCNGDGHPAGPNPPRHERERKPARWSKSLRLAGKQHRAVSEFTSRRLRQSAPEQPSHGRVPRLRPRSQPVRHLAGQRLRDRRRPVGARLNNKDRTVQNVQVVPGVQIAGLGAPSIARGEQLRCQNFRAAQDKDELNPHRAGRGSAPASLVKSSTTLGSRGNSRMTFSSASGPSGDAVSPASFSNSL